jgi:ribosomal protein L34E
VTAGELRCTKCDITKPESEFHREAKNPNRNYKRSNCKSCDAERIRRYVSLPGMREHKAELKRRSNRKLSYNFPPELYDERLEEQGNVCGICKSNTPGGRGAFHADHNHKTNQPRGVLCHNCNLALGNFKDNPEVLQAAIEYLKKYVETK